MTRKPNRRWMCLATLAAAEPGRILCVVPSRWPPSRSLEAVASTWLKDCDIVTIAVSARQYNASRGAMHARGRYARRRPDQRDAESAQTPDAPAPRGDEGGSAALRGRQAERAVHEGLLER